MKFKKAFFFIFIFLFSFIGLVSFNPQKILANNKPNENLSYYSLLDEYYLLNKFQGEFGLCWDFAGTRALESIYGKALNEYVSFSEASIALNSRGDIGGGSYFPAHFYALKESGISFENDFPYEELLYVNGKRRDNSGSVLKYYDFLENKKIKNLDKNLRFLEFRTGNNQVKEIKNHLLNFGAVYYDLNRYVYKQNPLYQNKSVILEKNYGSRLEAHAVTVVGFDDNYQIIVNGKVEKGAFIALNSNSFHKGDSIFYIPYTFEAENSAFGYRFIDENNLIKSVRNTEPILNKNAFKKSTLTSFTAKPVQFKNNNIFEFNKPIDITYLFPEGSSDISVNILDNAKNINTAFTFLKIGNKLTVKSKSGTFLSGNSYNLTFGYQKDGTFKKEYRQIHVINYAELLYTRTYGKTHNLTTYQNVDSRRELTILNLGSSSGSIYLRPVLNHKIKFYQLENDVKTPFNQIDSTEIKVVFPKTGEQIIKTTITFILEDNSKITRPLKLVWVNSDETTFVKVFNLKGDFNYDIKDNVLPVSIKKTSLFSRLDLGMFYHQTNTLDHLKLIDNKNNEIKVFNKNDLGYFLDFGNNLELLNKFFYNNVNFATRKMGFEEIKNYCYILFLSPVWIETSPLFKDLEISITGKNHFTALEKISVSDYQINARFNNVPVEIKITNLNYNEKLIEYGVDFLTFTLFYLDNEYQYNYPVSVKKRIVPIPDVDKNIFFFDNKPHGLSLKENDFYSVLNNEGVLLGTYTPELRLKDSKNYQFTNNLSNAFFQFEIIKPKISDFNLSIVYQNNPEKRFEALTRLNPQAFLVKGLLNEEEVVLTLSSINYLENRNVLYFGDGFVNLNFSFFTFNYEYQFNLKVIKKVISLPKINYRLLYNGKKQTPLNADKTLFNTFNLEKQDIGTYKGKVALLDSRNLSFSNKTSEIEIDFEILPPKIEITNPFREACFMTEDKISISKIYGKVNNHDFIFNENIKVSYENTKNYLLANTKEIKLFLNYFDYHFTYIAKVTVLPKLIAIPKFSKVFIYNRTYQTPSIKENAYFTFNAEKGINSGTYAYTLSIKDKENYLFENHQSEIKGVFFIEKAKLNFVFQNNTLIFPEGFEIEYFNKTKGVWEDFLKTTILTENALFRVKNNENYDYLEINIPKTNKKPVSKILIISLTAVSILLVIGLSSFLLYKKINKNKNNYLK